MAAIIPVMPKHFEGPPNPSCTEDTQAVIHHHLCAADNTKCISNSCKGLLCWQHVREGSALVCYVVHVKKAASGDTVLLELCLGVAFA